MIYQKLLIFFLLFLHPLYCMEKKKKNGTNHDIFKTTELGKTLYLVFEKNNIIEKSPQRATSFLEGLIIQDGTLRYENGSFYFKDYNKAELKYSCRLEEASKIFERAKKNILDYTSSGTFFREKYPNGPQWFIERSLQEISKKPKREKTENLFSPSDSYIIQLKRLCIFLQKPCTKTAMRSLVNIYHKELLENISNRADDTNFLKKLVKKYTRDQNNKLLLLNGIEELDEQKIIDALTCKRTLRFEPLTSELDLLIERVKNRAL